MAQFDFYDPRTQGLLTLAAGLLSQSGWQPQRVGLGQAFGQAALPAINAMNQARRSEVELEDARQMRALRELQMRQIGMEIGSAEALPGQLGSLNSALANIDQLIEGGGAGLPTGQFQPLPGAGGPQITPLQFAPEEQTPVYPAPLGPSMPMQQQLLGPWGGGSFMQGQQQAPVPRETMPAPAPLPADTQLAQTGQAAVPAVEVIDRQAQMLYDSADALERQMSLIPNMHPKAQAAWQASIKSIRDRAERLDKVAESRGKAPETRDLKIGEINGIPYTQPQEWIRGKGWVNVGKPTPQKALVSQNIEVATYDKTGAVKRAESVDKMNTSARQAARIARNIGYLADVLEGYGGGPITDVIQGNIGRVFPSSEWGKIASVQDLTRSIVGKSFQDIRQEGTGQVSDFESKTFISVFPTLAATPQGRQLIRAFAERTAQRELVASDVYAEMAEKGPVRQVEWDKEVTRRAGPLFTPEEWDFLKRTALQSGVVIPRQTNEPGWSAQPLKKR